MREAVHLLEGGAPGGRALPRNGPCKIADSLFIPSSAASFWNYAVGPWVSVAGCEAALARGNPV